MSQAVISVTGLGKKYRIKTGTQRADGLRDVVSARLLALGKTLTGGTGRRDLPDATDKQLGPRLMEDFWALRDINFDVSNGTVLGIIGRNGAGKSTLLKILSRITRPTTGRVRIKSRVASLLEVGTGFHAELTGRENIFLNGAILGMSRIDITKRFDQIVSFAGVEAFLDTPVKRYSSGMVVRLAFAVAAHLEPDILIIDEVLAVGDAEFQKKCLGKLHEVGSGGRTVLFVSHNMNAVEQLCNAAIMLKEGRIIEHSADVRGIIGRYLWTKEGRGASEWITGGDKGANQYFEPVRLWIGDESGNPVLDSVSNTDEAWVHIEGDVDRLDESLTVGYAIFDEAGTLLYWSYQTDSGENNRPRLQRGRNHLASMVPRRFLNEGRYRVELIASLHFREWLLEPGVSAPSIALQIQGGLSDSPYWMVRRPGILAPVLRWNSFPTPDTRQ